MLFLCSVVEEGNDLFPVSAVGTMRPDGPAFGLGKVLGEICGD